MSMRLTTFIQAQAVQGLPQTYWTDSKMAQFWDYVKWFLKFNMKWIMIIVAIVIAGMVIGLIVDILVQARKAQRGEEEDDDVEYY